MWARLDVPSSFSLLLFGWWFDFSGCTHEGTSWCGDKPSIYLGTTNSLRLVTDDSAPTKKDRRVCAVKATTTKMETAF